MNRKKEKIDMSKLIDLTGKRFGKMTVKSYVGEKKWLCICDCGRETTVFGDNLRKGHTTSCGCARGTGIIGRVVGDLTVMEHLFDNKYRCKCKCGNECKRTYESIVQSRTMCCDECAKKRKTQALLESDTFVAGTQPCKLHSKITKANKSGIVGVNWDKSRGKWQASIRFRGHKYNLGRFGSKFEAAEIREIAEKELFGNFLDWYQKYKEGKGADE